MRRRTSTQAKVKRWGLLMFQIMIEEKETSLVLVLGGQWPHLILAPLSMSGRESLRVLYFVLFKEVGRPPKASKTGSE